MKNRTFLGSIIGLASLLLLITSCTKDLEDMKPESNTAKLSSQTSCSDASGMVLWMVTHRQGTSPFFYRASENLSPGKVPDTWKQPFSGTDFSNQQFFVVTGSGGTLTHFPNSGAVGITDRFIDNNESVTLTLSACMAGYKMKTFHLVLNAGKDTKGTICLYNGDVLVEEVNFIGHDNPKTPGKGTINFPVEFHAKKDPGILFDKIVIKPTAGKLTWIAYQRNLNEAAFYSPTHFRLGK